MPVRFDEITFHNESGIQVALTIEAPIGSRIVESHPVAAQSEYRVSPGVDDCKSALLEVVAAHHSATRQSFATADPSAGQSSYLQRLVTRHLVGSSIRGHFSASNVSERGDRMCGIQPADWVGGRLTFESLRMEQTRESSRCMMSPRRAAHS
jgi:hypothetical protein